MSEVKIGKVYRCDCVTIEYSGPDHIDGSRCECWVGEANKDGDYIIVNKVDKNG